MSEYDNAVLADNPAAYWKGEDLSGSVMTDSSGNGEHGTILAEAVLGQPGPIETDGSSFGVRRRFGEHATVSGEPLDTRGNFTWEVWGRIEDVVQDFGFLCRNGSLGLNGSNLLGVNSGHVTGRVSVGSGGANTYDVADPSALVTSTYYYIALVRNSTVLTLQVNDLEVDVRSDFPAGDIVYSAFNNGDWLVGAFRPSGPANDSDGTSHAAIYPTALSYARRLAHYEAALNALFISGRSDANPTAILRGDFEPDPVSYPWRHNWAEALIERITWRTAVSQSVTGMEEAAGERLTPRRELEFTQVLKSNVERRKLRALLWANQHAKWFVPIRQYAERLLEPLVASSTLTPISTTFKDYEDGGYIGFRQLDAT